MVGPKTLLPDCQCPLKKRLGLRILETSFAKRSCSTAEQPRDLLLLWRRQYQQLRLSRIDFGNWSQACESAAFRNFPTRSCTLQRGQPSSLRRDPIMVGIVWAISMWSETVRLSVHS